MENKWIIRIPEDNAKSTLPYLHTHFSMPVFKPTFAEAKRFDKKQHAIDIIMQWDLDYCKLEKI